MTDKVIAALKSLDPTNDNHWTNDGAPRLETVRLLSANPGLSREAVNNALPGFNRAVASGAAPETKPEPTAEELAAAAAATEAAKGDGTGPATPPVTPETPAVAPAAPETPTTPPAGDTASEYPNLGGEPLAEAQPEGDATLLEILEDANEYLSKLLDTREKINLEITKAQNEVARAQAAHDDDIKSGHTLSPIQAYLASQVAQGQERGRLRRTVEETGVDLKELTRRLSPSPIDAALGQRKRQPRNLNGA